MGFQQGLSGLNAASQNLDAIGNNVSNANTVGFKASQAQFADVFANSLTGAGGLQIGIGTKTGAVVQQFTQGNITTTNNPLDVAINGGGFFRLNNNGAISYSRNGQFQLDKNGYIVTGAGLNLTGYPADAAGNITAGSPVNLQVSSAGLPPNPTANSGIQINLDSRANAIVQATTNYNYTDATTYTSSTSLSVYDSLGNPQTYTLYFVKRASNSWDVYGTVTNPAGTTTDLSGGGATPTALTTLTFSPSTGAITAGGTATQNITSPQLGTGAAALSFAIDFTGTTQYGNTFAVNSLTQDGYSSGRLSGFSIAADGVVKGRYSNGQSLNLGQIVLANFTNPQGLQPLGNNTWADTATSGVPLVGSPGSGSLGVLQSSGVEDSNVDMTAELVKMITAQRAYQANAQTIKTQDQVLQTLVNLR